MTALRFQTGWRHQKRPASLRAVFVRICFRLSVANSKSCGSTCTGLGKSLSVPMTCCCRVVLQTRRCAYCDGGGARGLPSRRPAPLLHPRGPLPVAQGAGGLPPPAGPGRLAVQRVLCLERPVGQHQHVLLVSDVRAGPRHGAAGTRVVRGRGEVVAGARGVHRPGQLEASATCQDAHRGPGCARQPNLVTVHDPALHK